MFRSSISDEDLQQLCDSMDQAERSGMFDGLFSGQYQKQNNVTVILTDLPTKKKLLVAISPNMRLTMDFFKRIYGYELSYPGFAEIAIGKLVDAGCSKAPKYYKKFVSEFEIGQIEKIRGVSELYNEKIENDREEVSEKRIQMQKPPSRLQNLLEMWELLDYQ